ncbi:hypothetical protein Zmor_001236 [Zophobas morio]|uniref:Reverse transcriptase domain-containing protein n=1 Tax=Zophobas morio TaxID=2755281 RepID=A0AA38J8I2_9CUCU|nr:hypothetical protein Zmor_001236 [Zophobas morio]
MSAYGKSCPLKKKGLGKRTPWWNRRLSLLHSGLRKVFSRAKNPKKTEDWEAYKEHRKEFKKELRKRKRETSRSFCSDITSTARLKTVLSKDYTYQPGFLKKEDGSFTATLEEFAELLLQTMFPGSTRTTSHSKRNIASTQSSRSAHTALHTVVNRIEWAIENKLSTLGVFLDIEGTFDKTTFKKIELALQEHNVNPTLSRWVSGLMRYREVLINVGGTEIEAFVDRASTGPVSSPFFFLREWVI